MFKNIKKNLKEKETTYLGVILFIGGIASVFMGKSTWLESTGITTTALALMGCSVRNNE